YWRTTFAVQKIATAVWSGVRVALSAAPSDLISLNASTHCWLCSDGGGGGRNWSALSSPNGRIVAIHGVCGAAYAGGVRRPTPGPATSGGNGEGRTDRRLQAVVGPLAQDLVGRETAVHDPVPLRLTVRDRSEGGVVERRQVRLLRGEAAHEDPESGLRDGGVRRLPLALSWADGAVHRHRDVCHVDEA